MKWLNYKAISIDTIERMEDRLQITLPDDYKQFVLKYDGGYPYPNHFKVDGKVEIFNNLISLDENEYDNIYEILEDLQDRLSDQLIPFAEDGFGNLLCFDYSADKNIVFWDHEKNYDDFKESTFVCSSFSSLIENLF
ncbi:MAG: SMI1/KNR4 family protein [Streptococcus peroris]|uniref:SMI1/KNR4 family protein n=1 Tax=Streptococcus peroris TaxID=68891 RepID=UPI0029080112|nr:SMI1/KNR4 family protein [Streptococcus peroris]MDU7074031.1 SMI1/KNR4 family protein [Streptococcus peroris]